MTLTPDDLVRAGEAIKRMSPTEPMRYAMGFDEAKWMILHGQAYRVMVSPKTLERLKADPELAALDRPA